MKLADGRIIRVRQAEDEGLRNMIESQVQYFCEHAYDPGQTPGGVIYLIARAIYPQVDNISFTDLAMYMAVHQQDGAHIVMTVLGRTSDQTRLWPTAPTG